MSTGRKILKYTVKTLMVIGAINWGLVGFFGANLVTKLFGENSGLTHLTYDLVGIAGLLGLVHLVKKACGCCNESCNCNCHSKGCKK